MSQLLSSLKVTLGNEFPESLIRIDYTRYDDCYRIRRALSYFYGGIFVLFQRVCSDSQDIFLLSFFDKLLRCYRQCLGRERQECGAEHYVTGKGME